MSTMHAWRKHRSSTEPVWEEVPIPKAPDTGFLCKMLASGVCHSDRSLLDDKTGRVGFQDKYTLGHEGCGEIIAVGAKLGQDCGFKVGDIIAMLAVPGCGASDCAECSRDVPQVCPRGYHSGIGNDGHFAPYSTIDIRGAAHVPKNVDPAAASVATDAVLTAYHAITRRAEVKADETVFLFGLGGLGFNALQIVHKAIGARVIVSDTRQERLDEAAKLGVPACDIVPVGKAVQEFVIENGLTGKIDTTLDFAGMRQTVDDAQHIVRIAGKIVQIGTLAGEADLHLKMAVRKRLSIICSYGGQIEDLRGALDLISKGVITPEVETAPLKEFPKALQDLCDGKVKGRVALTA